MKHISCKLDTFTKSVNMNMFIHQNGRVTDRQRQYNQQTDTYIMQSLLVLKT